MKNKLLGKQVTALVMGALMVVSGQALAFSSNNQEVINADVLSNSEFLVAQENPNIAVVVAVAAAVKAVDRLISVVRICAITEEFPPEAKDAVIEALEEVSRTLAEALAFAEIGDNVAVATAISQAISILESVLVTAQSGGCDVQPIAEAIARAKEAKAIAERQASGGSS